MRYVRCKTSDGSTIARSAPTTAGGRMGSPSKLVLHTCPAGHSSWQGDAADPFCSACVADTPVEAGQIVLIASMPPPTAVAPPDAPPATTPAPTRRERPRWQPPANPRPPSRDGTRKVFAPTGIATPGRVHAPRPVRREPVVPRAGRVQRRLRLTRRRLGRGTRRVAVALADSCVRLRRRLTLIARATVRHLVSHAALVGSIVVARLARVERQSQCMVATVGRALLRERARRLAVEAALRRERGLRFELEARLRAATRAAAPTAG